MRYEVGRFRRPMRRSTEGQLVGLVDLGDGSTLSLDFTAMSGLDSRFTFSRASTATFINSSGLVASAANGVARFDHDPATLAPRGLLIEASATNLLTRSSEYSTGTPWFVSGYTIGTGATSPDGANAAQRWTANSGSISVGGAQAVAAFPSTSVTFSIFWKNHNWTSPTPQQIKTIALRNDTTATILRRFYIDNPTSDPPTTADVTGSGGITLVKYPNGWWRIVVTHSAGITAGNTISVYVGGLYGSVTGAGEACDWWGAQLEASSGASSYLPTGSGTVQRAADVCSMTGSNFSSWYGSPTAFSMLFEGIAQIDQSYARVLCLSSGANTTIGIPNFNLGLPAAASNRPFMNAYVVSNNNIDTYVPVGGALTNGVPFKIGFRHQTSSHYITRGTLLGAANSYAGFAAGLANLYFGNTDGLMHRSVHYTRLKFWPSALSNAQLDLLAT